MLEKPAIQSSSGNLKSQGSDEQHQRELRRTAVRLILTYLAPLILLTVYFHLQSRKLWRESRLEHLKLVAEHQAGTLDLFLQERLVNLENLINDPILEIPPSPQGIEGYLSDLRKNSDAFVDIGFFDPQGVQVAYAGPYPTLVNQNYASEAWYLALNARLDGFIITDIYLGFRQKPHFTIAVNRVVKNQYIVLRATLDPGKIYEYLASIEVSGEASISIVNQEGFYQVVTPGAGTLIQESSIVPPREPRLGAALLRINGTSHPYGYSWLRMADWALITEWIGKRGAGFLGRMNLTVLLVSLAVIVIIFFIIIHRARKIVEFQEESSQTKAQLEHASKLATVGELAAGIAHEINNPLAVISEEAGLVKDLMSPEFEGEITRDEIEQSLDTIQEAVFRCRDITRKLLGFVRKTEICLATQNIHDIIDDVVDGFLTREMAVSNIEIIREFGGEIPEVLTDKNQLEQVLINFIKNSEDAIEGPGKITIATFKDEEYIYVSIADTGCGMSGSQLENIFLPFYTSKEVGKGTGLGLSVSYGIIKSLGGKIKVESALGKGSVFTISLPIGLQPRGSD